MTEGMREGYSYFFGGGEIGTSGTLTLRHTGAAFEIGYLRRFYPASEDGFSRSETSGTLPSSDIQYSLKAVDVEAADLFLILFSAKEGADRIQDAPSQLTPGVKLKSRLQSDTVHLLNLPRLCGCAGTGKCRILPVECGEGEGTVDSVGRPQITDVAIGAGDGSVPAQDQPVIIEPEGKTQIHLVVGCQIEIDIQSHIPAKQRIDLIREQGVDNLAGDQRVHYRTAGQ